MTCVIPHAVTHFARSKKTYGVDAAFMPHEQRERGNHVVSDDAELAVSGWRVSGWRVSG
jgi:hypothetical protein